MKKAQTEILGLALVIVLISLGLLFVVQFLVNKQPEGSREDYLDSQLANHFLSAVLVTQSADCKGKLLRDVAIACADGNYLTCNGGETACEYFNVTVAQIIAQSLVVWKQDFELWINVSGDDMYHNLNGTCKSWRRATFPLQTQTRGTLIADLKIC
ncbi:MAG: hypothetical protein V1735_05080 [Nanoarchaeota archaeon]